LSDSPTGIGFLILHLVLPCPRPKLYNAHKASFTSVVRSFGRKADGGFSATVWPITREREVID